MGLDHNTTDDYLAKLTHLNDDIAQDLIPAMVFVGLLMVLGLVGNILACFIFVFRLRMSTQHFLIVCLAVFDLLSCTIAMPTEIVDMRYFLMFENEFACRLLRFVNSYCAFASILTLIVIAVDRYRKVCSPLKRQMTLQNVKVSVVIVLFVALLFAIPAAIVYGIRTAETEDPMIHGHDCSTNDSVKNTAIPLVYNTVLFVAFLVILVTLTIIYVKIWREMKRHNRYMARNSDANVGRFYLASLSLSSVSENHKDNSDYVSEQIHSNNYDDEASPRDDVFTDLAQDQSPKKKSRFWGLRSRFKFGSKESEKELTPKCPSIQSDTTYCDTDSSLNSSMKKTRKQSLDKNAESTENKSAAADMSSSVKSDITHLADENDLHEFCKPQQSSEDEKRERAMFHDNIVSVIELDSFTPKSSLRTDFYLEKETEPIPDEGIQDCDEGDRKTRVNSHGFGGKSHIETLNAVSSDAPDRDIDASSKECGAENQMSSTKPVSEEGEEDTSVAESTNDNTNDVSDEMQNAEDKTVLHEQSECENVFSVETVTKDTIGEKSPSHTTHSVVNNGQDTGDNIVSGTQSESRLETSAESDSVSPDTEYTNDKTASNAQCKDTASADAPSTQDVSTTTVKSPTSRSVRIATTTTTTIFTDDSQDDSDSPHHISRPRRPSLPTPPPLKSENRRPSLPANVHKHPETRRPSLVARLFKHRGSDASRRQSVQSAADENFANGITRRRLTSKRSVSEVKSYKATVIAMSVTVVFFLSFVPHLSLITTRIVIADFDRDLKGAALVLYNIFLRSYFINSVSNPIIYGVQNARFRAECVRVFHLIFSACKRKLPVGSQS
ncbi:uncharacterized protein [Littorina saxatilis]|uniref:G-protein coupled receptors family 1 profile domain-containing protein n=1 Tax=Littorina saxatilis TaxID=31220 RepID=A0AAN9ARP4_9CAEN